MRFFKYIATILAVAALSSFWSCDNDDNGTLAKAVLASASTLNFDGNGATSQVITVYADADWVTEVPDWVTVNPTSGHGVMDVTISVSDNMRGGALDNPRKANVVFKGSTLASRAEVLVSQSGDKYRDVGEYKPGEIAALPDETVVSVPDVIVMAVTTAGFVVNDVLQSGNIYVLNSTTKTVAVGDKVSLMGSKETDTHSLPVIDSDVLEIDSSGNTVTYPTAKDITGEVDTYTSNTRAFIKVSGVLRGNSISIKGAGNSVNIMDAPASMNLAALNGHNVTVQGYFAGVAAPVIRIMAVDIEDKGVAKIIYFSEDFEWLDPWAIAGSAGRTVETDDMGAAAPQIGTPQVEGVTALAALENKGYGFLRVTPTSDNATECIYLQNNYLKFGKTGYQGGIIFPKIEGVPSGAELVLTFDWSVMRQGSGVIDPVNLIVIITNGGNETTFELPVSSRDIFPEGAKIRWVKAEIELTGITITETTKITVRQTNWKLSTANRWFLDNVELYQEE